MSVEIQIVEWNDSVGIQALTNAVRVNEEPGFQVDGVREYSQLETVFSCIQDVMPSRTARFDDVYNNKYRVRLTIPHTDKPGSSVGLAVHHNISDIAEVELGTAWPDRDWRLRRLTELVGIDPNKVPNFRQGVTTPGRLTVFSEGGIDGLRQTAHYFKRLDAQRPQRWARYTTSAKRLGVIRRYYARWVAREAIAEANQYLDALVD